MECWAVLIGTAGLVLNCFSGADVHLSLVDIMEVPLCVYQLYNLMAKSFGKYFFREPPESHFPLSERGAR